MQKIIRVTEYDKLHLDEYVETWEVVRVLNRDEHGYMYVLLELNEEETAKKQERHQQYLNVVSRIDFGGQQSEGQ